MSRRIFSTKTDPRIAMAVYCLGKLEELARTGKIPGVKKKDTIKLLERLSSVLLKMRESGYSKKALLSSQLFKSYTQMLSNLISRLGVNWYRVAKRKDEYTAKLLRFVIFNIRTLGTRLKKAPDGFFASATKIRFVKIIKKEPHPKNPKYKIYHVTDWEVEYEVISDDELNVGDVVLFAHMPPKNIDGIYSEGVFLKDEKGELIRGTDDDVGSTPVTFPESVEKTVGTELKKLLEDAFLI